MTTDDPTTETTEQQTADRPYGYYRIDFARGLASGWAAHADRVELIRDGKTLASVTPEGTDSRLQKAVPSAVPFELPLPRRFTALDFVSKKVRLVAVSGPRWRFMPGRRRSILKPTDGFRVVCVDKARQELDKKAIAHRGSGGVDHPERVFHAQPENYSSVHLPVGYSADPAVMGFDGVMFLTGGSNSLLEQYRMPNDQAEDLAEEWVRLLQGRAERCAELGIQYVQTILPEKLTVLPELAPVQVNDATPIFRAVVRRLRRESWWVNVLPSLERVIPKRASFFALDTHLSPLGTQTVAEELFSAVEPRLRDVVRGVPMSATGARRGDLGKYFSTLPFYEQFALAMDSDFAPHGEGVTLTGSGGDGSSSQHQGLWFDFQNSTAPSSKSVMVFGSSSFGLGDHSERLGWWAKHLFSSYRMRWQSEFDWEQIERIRPDVVIGQTIERFMPKVPTQ